MNINSFIANELNITEKQVTAVVNLLNDGATIPFIARYRKEHTGGLNEDVLRDIEDRLQYLKILEARKETILKSIEEQGKLTDELKEKILSAVKLQEVEDLYLPYKPKRKTRGTVAKAKGLEPLALFIIDNPNYIGDFDSILENYINEEFGVTSKEDALQGAKDIIAEIISDNAEVRKIVRNYLFEEATLVSVKAEEKKEAIQQNKKDVYDVYHNFSSPVNKLKQYQILAINRGEKEGFLKVSLSFEKESLLKDIYKKHFTFSKSVFDEILNEVIDDSFARLIYPSIEREIRNQLTDEADLHAVEIFASNLRQLLLQPPIANKIILGIDPGFVSGSKIAVIDSTGKYLEGTTIYPHPPQSRFLEAKKILAEYINRYKVNVIAIGNGTASRETELLVAETIKENKLKCHYIIVNEAGASVYSASAVAKEEFPDLEASQRGNISIARRVLDPLAELVKIDPKSIGVGLYQHDVDQKLLSKKLDDVVLSCVNYVGVDVNTASVSLLNYVSGLNKRIAKNIVKHREKIGKFKNRFQLLEVSGIGEKAFEQCAGFLRIPNGENPLDNTSIHPESYQATEKLLKLCELSATHVNEKGNLVEMFVKTKGVEKVAKEIGIGEPTLIDIIENLKKPGRDPREELPKPILRSDVLKIEDLKEGMKLKGTVRNVVDFGAFVDIGVKQDGLLHISQIANKFVKNPLELLKVGDIIDVTIIGIDIPKQRISLSMIK
ncbi:Tex family protein [Stygiobacter electus]|uniref:Tex family protein n=1 Tax=Stygiobacter electus TaxID=3032292 RepID=A0AAE3TDP0_9BACT|nr:Tex family protein [Stygiobacter electus]MDF1612736.1 Tex family protein [Stygiobacter electus]